MQTTFDYYKQLRINQGETPQKVSFERFTDMLNVLPPCKWVRTKSSETFFVSEAETADLHRWFARIGDEYFELVAPRSLMHEDILLRIVMTFDDVYKKYIGE